MLELRPKCECCDRDLPADSSLVRICSFECTFCQDCADGKLGAAVRIVEGNWYVDLSSLNQRLPSILLQAGVWCARGLSERDPTMPIY